MYYFCEVYLLVNFNNKQTPKSIDQLFDQAFVRFGSEKFHHQER